MTLVSEKIMVSAEREFEFEYDGKTLTALLTPHRVFVEDIGEFGGASMTFYGGKERHMCGLQGYNPMLGDTCPACDEHDYHSRIFRHLKEVLRAEGLIGQRKI